MQKLRERRPVSKRESGCHSLSALPLVVSSEKLCSGLQNKRCRQMRFRFPHSHAFRRGRVTIDDDGKAGPECLVEFGDGIIGLHP